MLNATKSQRHKIPQNTDFKKDMFCEYLVF